MFCRVGHYFHTKHEQVPTFSSLVSGRSRNEEGVRCCLANSPPGLMKIANAVKVEPVGEFELKGIRRPLAAYNVLGTA